MRIPAAALVAALLAASPAAATANLDCGMRDRSVRFDLSGLLGRSAATAIMSFEATLTVRAKGMPRAVSSMTFEGSDLVQRWILGDRIDLALQRAWADGPRSGTVTIVIRSGSDDGDGLSAPGRYVLTVTQAASPGAPARSWRLAGRGGCSLG